MVTITESGRIIEAGNQNLSLVFYNKSGFQYTGGASDGSEKDRGVYRPAEKRTGYDTERTGRETGNHGSCGIEMGNRGIT